MNPNWCKSKSVSCLFVIAAVVLFLPTSLNAQVLATASSNFTWPQWGLNPQHTGFTSPVIGQPPNQIAASFVYDFNVAAEKADPNNGPGDLLVHYQVPLVDGNDVFIESKDGTYTNGSYSTQRWHQNKYTWQGSKLVKVWTFN